MLEYRTCLVEGVKALFHKWVDYEKPVSESILVGGAPAGIIKFTLGLIEYEDGTVNLVPPVTIKFCDTPHIVVKE